MTTNTINAKAASIKDIFSAAAQHRAALKDEAAQKLQAAENDDDKISAERSRKFNETHEAYNERLSSMSEKALALVSTLKIDADSLALQSRELKKRSCAILEALASASKVDDNALDAILERLATKKDAVMTLDQIKREMNHSTTTQAQYFKTCALFFDFATYSKSEKALTFKYDNRVLRDLLKVYNVASVASE